MADGTTSIRPELGLGLLLFLVCLSLRSAFAFPVENTEPKTPPHPTTGPSQVSRSEEVRRYLDPVAPHRFSPELFDEYHKLPPKVAQKLHHYLGKEQLKADPNLRVQLNHLSGGSLSSIEQQLGRLRMTEASTAARDLEGRQKFRILHGLLMYEGLQMISRRAPRPDEAAVREQARAWLQELRVPRLLRLLRQTPFRGDQPEPPVPANAVQREALDRLRLSVETALRGPAREERCMSELNERHASGHILFEAAPQCTRVRGPQGVDAWNRWLRAHWGRLTPQERDSIQFEAQRRLQTVRWDTAHGAPQWAPWREGDAIRKLYPRPRPRRASSPASSTDSGPARAREQEVKKHLEEVIRTW